MFCIVKAIFGFLSFLPLLEASSCDADPGPSKNPALLQVKRHPLETVQPEVIPPLQQVHKGPLFEQCRTRASSSPHLTRRGFEAQNATVSLLSSGRSCSADPVTLVAFSSNGQATISCCDAVNMYCSGCTSLSASSCAACAGGFHKSGSRCAACRDVPGWRDAGGRRCKEYVQNGVCLNGAIHENKFQSLFVSHMTLKEYRAKGLSAFDACCACGGGMRASTPFRYGAAGKAFVLGEPMLDRPHPRTAQSYRVHGLLDGATCDLHSYGLSLDPVTGQVSGTPKAEEPTSIECTIEAVEDEAAGLVSNTTLTINLQYFAYDAEILSFPNSAGYLPRTKAQTSYSNWRVACTPHTAWLTIDGSTGRLSSGSTSPGTPPAAYCTVTAFNGTADQALSLPVVYPNHWSSMELRQSVGSEKVSVGPVLDLIAGRAVPPVSFSSADASESPPVAFYAACTSSATTDVVFDVTTGDLLVRGHAAFRLQMLSGELTGIPDMGVLEQCQNVARCKLQLDCSFFGELPFQAQGAPQFVKRSVQVVIRDDTCWQLADDKWQTLRSLPTHLGGTCRARCRADAGCAAYAETNSGGCYAVRRVSADACPKLCGTCGSQACHDFCRGGQCSSSSAGTSVDCRGCAPSDFTRAHVRINDCDGASSCLMIRKTGPGAAFLEGEYCPTEDGEKDGLLPWYAKAGEVEAATLYLAPFRAEREVGLTPCPNNTAWVIRRSSKKDFFEGSYVEMRGTVLACLDQSALGVSAERKTFGIMDSVLDEMSSSMHITILDSEYLSTHGKQHWGGTGMGLVHGSYAKKTQDDGTWAFMHTANATEHVSVKMPTTSDVRHMVLLSSEPGHRPVQATAESLLEEETEVTSDVDEDDEEDLAMDAEDTEVGQSWTSERRRRNRRRRRSRRRRRTTTTTTTTTSTLPNTYVGFQINDGLLYVVTKNTQQQIQAPSGMSSVATVEAKVVGSSVVVFLDGSEVASIAKPTTGPLYGALWSSRGAAVELPDVFDEVLVSPVSQQCSNPLDEREAAKSKAEEETNPEDFLFDDPNVPLGVENLYSLSPCECFSGDFGNAPPVDDGSFATMPPGSDNSYLPASLLIVSGSLSCEPSNLLQTLVDTGAEGCEMACRSGDYTVGSSQCNFYFTGSYTDVTVCRLYSACDSLLHEVNSHGELYGVSRQESCLLSSPELCRAKKREKWLAGAVDSFGDCLFEPLLQQCDAILIHGGHGISECGQCTHMLASDPAVIYSKLKRPLPPSFDSGASLHVRCGHGFSGLDRFSGAAKATEEIICQDGRWVDTKGGPGLVALQCVACARATPTASDSLLEHLKASQQERWWLKRHPVEIKYWNGLCLATESGSVAVDILFTDPMETWHRRRRQRDSGFAFGATTWGDNNLRLGWKGDAGKCNFEQRTQVVSLTGEWTLAGGATKSETLQGLLSGVRYAIYFNVKAEASVTTGLTTAYSSGWGCGGFSTSVWAHCPEEVSCPSGSTMVACQAVPSFSPYGHTPLGAVVTSSGTCKAWGNYAMGAKALGGTEVTGPETTSDQWSEWATCPSGSVAVTVRRLIAGVDIDGTKGDWNLKYFSNSKDSEKTVMCDEGTYIKQINACSEGKWDGMDSIYCTDGKHKGSYNDGCSRRRSNSGRRRGTNLNSDRGARKAYGQGGGNLDKLCLDGAGGSGGYCRGSHNSAYVEDSCKEDGLIAGFREYHRRRSVRFVCRQVRPVVKAFECNDQGCRVVCNNDRCKIMPFCLEGAGTDDVTEGPQQQSSSGGSWTPWSNCPSGFSAVGLRRLVLRGSLVDGEVSSVDQVECTGTGCRAKNPKYGTKVRAACVRNSRVKAGTLREKTGGGWSDRSSCPSGYDPIGVWSLTKEKTYDTMRMWDCSSSGCRIGCIGSGKCSIQTACIGAMTLAKATCSTAHQNLQVVASSSGSGTRTPAACPSTHNSAGCVCYSSTEGSCPAENYQVGKLTGSCSKNFGSASGTVTRLCTQAVGRLRVSIGNEITELDDLTAGYVYKSVAITSANTGNANMKFRELGGKPITLSVKDVTISDMVTGETTQSLLLDLANVCSGTRWEIELPAQQSGTPYTVKVTYGDQRMDMETSSCMLGTAGHMASVSAGTVAKGDFKTVQRSVFVPGNSAGVGNLVFSGEAASGCTGINKIEIAREDTVLWTDCGAPYSKGWNLKQSNSAPGNFQLVERAREGASNAKACVNPKSGKLVECAPESQVEEHIKQVFSLDYLAPLVAKWTQFESGQNLQPGSCVRARNQYLPNLKISSNQQDNHLVSCGTGQVLSSYLFKQDSSCNHVDDFRYFHSCTAIIPVTTTSSCVNLATRCVAHSNNHPHVWELDRHDVGAECAPGMLLTRFGYTSCSVEGGGGYQYTYTCCPVQGSGDCTEAYTEWGEVGQLSDLSALQHHHLQCPRDSGLKRFILEAQVPEVAADETLQGEVRYNFVCCKLPLAAPVSVRTGPLLAEDVQPWEGTYCPVGRTEGRPDFTRLAGSWPQMSVLKNTYCGYKKGLCSGDVMIGDDGGKWTSTARDLAGTICGAICAKHKDCQGLIATNSQGCAYRQHPHCWKEANSGIDCWVRINTSEMKIGFDRLGGSWCMTPEGGTAKCSSLTEVAHPLELLPNAGGVDYAPLVPMETDFEGNGATEVERDDMAQSLLGVSAAVSTRAGTNGGLGNQKFKKLPKIPKAKFQPAKFEMAEFKPFEGERKALERRGVTEHVLNWAPNAITYAPHCLARENREMILGAEPVDGAEHFLSSEERKKDVVGACYHALGVDGGGLSAVETWGEDATSDWTPPYPMDMMFSGHQGYPGLTADAVWECSTRDINRGYKLAMWERQADFNKAIIDLSGKPISKGICAAIPGTLSLVGAIAAYAGVKFETSKVCDAIAANIQGAATFMIEKRQSYREKRYIESDFQDCNPLQNTMAKVYCDLSCVEDAVKRGDEEILSSIGTLNRNILSEMKAFFDHYVSEIFTRLTHIEDKSSHESGQLKQVLDSYARAEIDAVNSNGKQIINAMNTQHSAMNRNLGNAAKQIFDLTHEEHKVLAATMKAHLQATSNAIDNLKAETQQGFHDAFNEFADTLSQEDLLELSKVSRSRRAALAQLNAWEDSVQSAGGQKLQQIEQALLVLQKRVQETPKEGNLTEHVMKMHEDVTSTVGELHELRKQPTAHESPAGTVDAEMKTLLSAAEKSLESHAMAAERMGRLIGALQSSDHLTSNAEDFHVEAQMVEFDKILVKIRGAAEEYLSESQEQAKLVREASKLTEQYLSKCTADFLELQLAAKKALQSGNKAARAARKAMKEVAQQVALLAEMLVDGGLARHALQRAAAQLAQRGATTAEDLEEVSDEPSSSHNMTSNAVELFQLLHAQRSASAPSTALELLASEEFHRALQMDLLANLRLRMPPVLPKALAAWRLFEDLQQRHAMHGLARVGSRDTELVRSAWERLDREVLLLASEIHVVASGLGEAWAARAQSMLEILAPVPARCQKLLPSSSGWMMWSNSTDGSSLLVRGATHLLQHHPKRHRVAHDFAQTTGDVEARICSHSASPSTLRAVHPGEAVLCFQRSPALKCTSWLTLESELDLWLM